MKRLLLICLPFFILLIVSSCKVQTKDPKADKPAPTPIEYSQRLSAEDIEILLGYNYTPEMGWWRRNYKTNIRTFWEYNVQNQTVVVREGFSEFNRDLDLPVHTDNSLQYLLQYSRKKDTLLISELSQIDTITLAIAISKIPADPISFCKGIDMVRTGAELYSVQHQPHVNLTEVRFSPNDQFFYVPDSIITNYDMPRTDEFLDSMSISAIQYIKDEYQMITKNWYYNNN